MATRKTLSLECDPETARAFAAAIHSYAEAAYPAGGSECSQVANQTLRDTARVIAASGQSGTSGVIEIPRRQRVMLKAALEWYLAQPGVDLPDTVRTRLGRLFARAGS